MCGVYHGIVRFGMVQPCPILHGLVIGDMRDPDTNSIKLYDKQAKCPAKFSLNFPHLFPSPRVKTCNYLRSGIRLSTIRLNPVPSIGISGTSPVVSYKCSMLSYW